MKNKFLSFLKYLIGWPVSALALFFIIKLIISRFPSIETHISQIQPLFILYGISCFVAYYFLRSFLWQQILKNRGFDLGFVKTSYLWGFAELKRYVPGFIWSLVGRGVMFGKEGMTQKDIIHSVIEEAEIIVASNVLLAGCSLPFFFYFFFPGSDFKLIPILFCVIALLLGLFVFQTRLNRRLWFLLSGTNEKINFIYLIIGTVSFFLFGLGAYFTISSIIYLDPALLIQLIGLFQFSYLLGYVLVIFPMGFGVREGIITIGLSKLTKLELAGLSSILLRLTTILSEFLFLTLVFILHRIKNNATENALSFVSKNKHLLLVSGIALVFVLYFSAAATLRYDNFYTGRYDLGNMDQTVWNTMRGRIFQTNDDGGAIVSRLSTHADFILILIAPLYKLWADPRLLVILQSIIVGLGSLFVFGIANHLIKNKNLATAFAFAYLLNPALEHSLLYDFHAVVLATTFLLGAYYFLLKKKVIWFTLFVFFAGLTKEQVWLVVSLLFFIFAFQNREKKRFFSYSITGAIVSFSLFYALVWHIIPAVRKGQHFALAYYSDFGNSPTAILKTIIFSPLRTLAALSAWPKIIYVGKLLLPLGFLPLLCPFVLLLAVPDLAINLLSSNTQLIQIAYHYTAVITPFLFIAALCGSFKLMKNKQISTFSLTLFVLLFALFGAYELGPLPGAKYPNIDMFTKPLPNKHLIEEFLLQIPKRLSIAATNNLGSHLSRRQKIYTLPVGADQADVVMFLLNDRFAQPSPESQRKLAAKIEHDKNYYQVFKLGDFIAFEKKDLYIQKQQFPQRERLFPLSIPTLEEREYGTSEISIGRELESTKSYKSFLLSYESDGLSLHALYTQPKSPKPVSGYPVLIVNHGYIPPREYDTLSSYKGITDYFASSGFIVLKPDYRGNADSEGEADPTLRRFEYPIDVMNLIASVASLSAADSNSIFLWGHSMGGEITLKALEIASKNPDFSDKIKAAVLWAPVTDPIKWFSKSHAPTLPEYAQRRENLQSLYKVLGVPSDQSKLWLSLSPLSFLSDVTTPVKIFHGTSDITVPNQWSIELYNDLKSLGKQTELTLYPNNDHNLSANFADAAAQSVAFFKRFLPPL